MRTRLAEYVLSERFAQCLSLGDLARRLGSKNISKTAGRLDRFEKTGQIDGALQGGERWNTLSDRLRFSRAIGCTS
jgi:hypothetical protein